MVFNAATAPAPRLFSAEALDAIRQCAHCLPFADTKFPMPTNKLLKGATVESAAVSDMRAPIASCKQGMQMAVGC